MSILTYSESKKSSQQKQQIMVPPMRYDLKQGTSANIIDHLENLNINRCSYTTGPVTESIECFKQTLQTRHEKKQFTTFGYIPAPPDSDITRQVIGTEGYFFKMTTTLCEVDFIWHDRENQVFLFWGSSIFKVVKALNSIRWRIHKIYMAQQAKQSQQATTTTQYILEDISEDDDTPPPALISHEDILLEQKMKKMNVSKTIERDDVNNEHGFDVNEND